MKKALILALSLMMIAIFAVGCSTDNDKNAAATATPVVEEPATEATPEVEEPATEATPEVEEPAAEETPATEG